MQLTEQYVIDRVDLRYEAIDGAAGKSRDLSNRVGGDEHGDTFARARMSSGFDGDYALFFIEIVRTAELPHSTQKGTCR
jgi:hypothetical protein